MRPYSTHTLAKDREKVFTQGSSEALALVDLETYPPFVGEHADQLDLMAHLYDQTKALTAVAWDIPGPGAALNLRLVLTEDDDAVDRLARFRYGTTASGWVRTNGQLCLADHDRLFACAHDAALDLLPAGGQAKNSRPRVLNVPPGTYSVLVLHHIPSEDAPPQDVRNFTVVLRHYPFPAPRVAPVRLPALIPCTA